MEIPQTDFVLREQAILSSTAYSNDDIAEVVQYLDEKRYDPAPVVTHHFSQEDVVEAFTTAIENSDKAIKIVIDVHP